MIPLITNDIVSDPPAEGIVWGGIYVSTALGAWLGPKISRNGALKAIKESIKLRVVE